jgi:uncharacterized membrane protein
MEWDWRDLVWFVLFWVMCALWILALPNTP